MRWADIAIVGGGLVGLSCAHMLCRALPHAKIQLVEKRPLTPSPTASDLDARYTALSMGSVNLLRALDLWQYISGACPILDVQVSDRGHLGRVSYRADSDSHPLGYVVANGELGQALANTAHLHNLSIRCPAEVEEVLPREQSVEYRLQTGERCKAALLIVADGADSDLRRQLGIAASVHDYQQHAVVTNVAFDRPHRGRAFERFTEEGPMALLPLTAGGHAHRAALVLTRPRSQVEACLAWSEPQFLAYLQGKFSFPLGRFTGVGKRASYPLRRLLAQEQVRSHIVLLGNAAHSLHPVAGQGFNLALRDAMQLVSVLEEADCAAAHYGDLALLQRYAERQRGDQWRTVAISHGFNSLFSTEKTHLQLLRNAGLVSLELLPFVKRGFFSQMMGRGQRQVQPNFMRAALWSSS